MPLQEISHNTGARGVAGVLCLALLGKEMPDDGPPCRNSELVEHCTQPVSRGPSPPYPLGRQLFPLVELPPQLRVKRHHDYPHATHLLQVHMLRPAVSKHGMLVPRPSAHLSGPHVFLMFPLTATAGSSALSITARRRVAPGLSRRYYLVLAAVGQCYKARGIRPRYFHVRVRSDYAR